MALGRLKLGLSRYYVLLIHAHCLDLDPHTNSCDVYTCDGKMLAHTLCM